MRLLVTRRMPEAVIAAARSRFDVVIRDVESEVLTADELRAALRDFDVVMPTLGDRFSAAVFADVPNPRCQLLANFGVGFNHIDVARCGDRCHRRYRAVPDPDDRPAFGRR
jgi:lactate dehydrogenase-like 2-hydroxyacid dehydrogenase